MPVRDHIPQLAVLHLRSQGMNLQSLREFDFAARLCDAYGLRDGCQTAAVGTHAGTIERCLRWPFESEAILRQAELWTSDQPRGWRQVEAIVAALRGNFTLDPDAAAPEDCPNVVAHFLEVRRGPDYLFATTAATLLRSLGYPCRLVSGFYVRAERFDRRAGQTAVLAQDVHVWAEVCVDGKVWIPIEPTPGFDPPRESLTWSQRVSLAWQATGQWCMEHTWSLMALMGATALVWVTRLRWLDWAFIVWCRVASVGSLRRRVLWTVRLLEWRAWLAGSARPRTVTLSGWHGVLISILPREAAASLQHALQLAERLLYTPPGTAMCDVSKAETARMRTVIERRVGVACFRRALPGSGRPRRDQII
jgi:hypothetical protein